MVAVVCLLYVGKESGRGSEAVCCCDRGGFPVDICGYDDYTIEADQCLFFFVPLIVDQFKSDPFDRGMGGGLLLIGPGVPGLSRYKETVIADEKF